MATPTPPAPVPTPTPAPVLRSRSELSLSVDQQHEPAALPLAEEVTTRKPSRRLSMPYNKPLSGKYALPTRSTHRRQEAALQTQQFERMMDRFQLRRVPLPRTRSISTHSTLTLQREPAQATLYGSATAREPSRFISARDQETIDEHAVDAVVTPNATTWSISAVADRFAREALDPTASLAQLRLVSVTAVVVVQLVYVPFVLQYAQHTNSTLHQSWSRFGLTADVIFLLSMIMMCNTATYTSRGYFVTTRRAIFRQYCRRGGLLLDVLAVLPLETFGAHPAWFHALCLYIQLALRCIPVYPQWRRFQVHRVATAQGDQQTWIDWFLYSRFGHLVRVGRLVLVVVLLAHYLACAWTFLRDPIVTVTDTKAAIAVHIHSIYDVLQLLQGQGMTTTTVAQDVFGLFAVLLGSIALAVVFGHVAVLIANFTANQAAYQRRMENVFAIMGKLQLPHPIRERVHQYYEYLHVEYESLDGELGKFTKDLSHTLELEVVLFKYMDAVMHVPHWRECSADFQKQLVLNLSVRVYLPDDFVIRRGEVGTSCFIINRGVCKQYEYSHGNDEGATLPLPTQPITARETKGRPSGLRYSAPAGTLQSNLSTRSSEGAHSYVATLVRGQALGEKALITNYERSSDVRAFTYVEMCVLEREPFQRMLTRYPHDRKLVLTNIVRKCVTQRALQGLECSLMSMVHRVAPLATIEDGVRYVVDAMSPKVSDPTILVGATEHLEDSLTRVVNTSQRAYSNLATWPPQPSEPCDTSALAEKVDQLQGQLDRIEQVLQSLGGRVSSSHELPPARPKPSAENGFRQKAPSSSAKVMPQRVGVVRRTTRLNRRASETLLSVRSSPVAQSTHAHYADRLFKTQHAAPPSDVQARVPP